MVNSSTLGTLEDWQGRLPPALSGGRSEDILFGREAGPRAERPVHSPWKILARVDHRDAEKSRQQAHDDWNGGTDGFVLAHAGACFGLQELPLHNLILRNEGGDAGALALQKMVGSMPLDPSRLQVDFGVSNPLLAKAFVAEGYSGPLMRADGRAGHAQGFSNAEELGVVLAVVLQHFRGLDFLDDKRLTSAVSVTLAAAQNPFLALAKFRAVRLLWQGLLEQCGLPFHSLNLHGETSMLMFSNTDAHGNILRSVAAAFGAGLGGADSFCVLPFSQLQGVPNEFSRRVARNLQHVLLREAQVWRVQDPASGAGFIESETRRLCSEAWDVMRACERGHWPTGGGSIVRPVVGVERYQSPHQLAAEIEVGA